MTKITQEEWERAVAEEARKKPIPPAARWKYNPAFVRPVRGPATVVDLPPAAPAQPALRFTVERRGACVVFWLRDARRRGF